MLATYTDADWHGLVVCNERLPEQHQKDRIHAALGALGDRPPVVGEETILRYYQYLATHLSFPFTAHYPVPRSPEEDGEYRCTVVELLDPRKHIWDEFDGIFCKTRKGSFEVKLPLTELKVAEDTPDFQLIEDYWYWFWNWR